MDVIELASKSEGHEMAACFVGFVCVVAFESRGQLIIVSFGCGKDFSVSVSLGFACKGLFFMLIYSGMFCAYTWEAKIDLAIMTTSRT